MSLERVHGESDPQFMEEWAHHGPRQPAKNSDGEEVWTLWRIWNKCTLEEDGPIHYEVQYWENERGKNLVHPVSAEEIWDNYQDQVYHWEEKHGKAWQKKYPNGNCWSSTAASQLARPGKRDFNDTPQKARQSGNKKPKMSDNPVFDDSNEDDDEEEDGIVGGVRSSKDPFLQNQTPKAGQSIPLMGGLTQSPNQDQTLTSSPESVRGYSPLRELESQTSHLTMTSRPKARSEQSADSQVCGFSDLDLPRRAESPELPKYDNRSAELDDSDREGYSTPRMSRNDSLEINASEEEDDNAFLHSATAALDAAYEESQREFEDDLDSSQSQALDGGDPNQYEEYSQQLQEAHSKGLLSLISVALELKGMPCDNWVEKMKASTTCCYEDFLVYLVLMMAGSDPLILQHFVQGDIPKAEKQNADLEKKLRQLRNVGDSFCPSIYVQYLVNDQGESPTPQVLLDILDFVELYTRGYGKRDGPSGQLAAEVDSAMGTKSWSSTGVALQGKRRYIESDSQFDTCLAWVESSRARLSRLPLDKPLDRPFAELGYASNPNVRLNQHAKHTSSNYLMNLTEAICMAKFNENYSIKQYVVLHLIHYAHAMWGEILYHRIGLIYTMQGGGFSHHVAGASHGGAEKNPGFYGKKADRLFNDPEFKERVATEVRFIEERGAMYNEMSESAARQDEVMRNLIRFKESAESVIESANDKTQAEEEEELTDPILKLLELADLDTEMTG